MCPNFDTNILITFLLAKFQNNCIYIKTSIQEFEGAKEKVRKLFLRLIFWKTRMEHIVFAGLKVIYHLEVYT